MIRVALKGVGVAAPGLAGWSAAQQVLSGAAAYLPPDPSVTEPPYAPLLLPPNERRRATAAVRQAFRAAEDAMPGHDPRTLASVFASSDADMAVLHRICSALAEPARAISPTDFHNSVHNAASGYWSIAVQSMANTTTIAAYDASFTAGLLEAAALAVDPGGDGADVLLVAFDAVAPDPLHAKRPLAMAASVALVLGRESPTLGQLAIELSGEVESSCAQPALEPLRAGNPALRALPLLELLAMRRAGTVTLRGTGELRVNVTFGPGPARADS